MLLLFAITFMMAGNGMQRHIHGKSLRVGRFSQVGHSYLVTCVTKDRQPVFTDFYLARRLVNELRRIDESAMVGSLAWVIMPDHLSTRIFRPE